MEIIMAKPRSKKPPACDYCKARRALCHPQPEGKSCPRCLEKGVKCTTTPSVRKRRRQSGYEIRFGAAKRVVNTNEGDNSNEDDTRAMDLDTIRNGDETRTSRDQDLQTSTTRLTLTTTSEAVSRAHMLATSSVGFNNGYTRPIACAPVSSRPLVQLPKRLMQDLFNVFIHAPYRLHPIIPYDRIRARLAGCGWQTSFLSPQERVLVHCIFAHASTVSTDPLIIGPEPLPVECINILTTIHPVKRIKRDLTEIGRRRESVGLCHQLRAEALRQAHNEGIAVWVSPENAASCCLLDALVSEYDGPNSYGAAFTWQVRRLAESWYQQPQLYNWTFGTIDCSVRWAAFLSVDVFAALHSDRSVDFSAHDEQLICGHDQLSLEELMLLLGQGCNGLRQYYGYFLSIIFQITRHARELLISINQPPNPSVLTNWIAYARSRPYDLQAIKSYVASLDLLHHVCDAFGKYAVTLVNQNQSQSYTILNVLNVLSIGWTNLALHFYKTIQGMLEQSSVTDLYTATPHGVIDDVYRSGGLEQLMSSSELAPVFSAARVLACRAAIEFSKQMEEVYWISRFAQTKIKGGQLKKWVQLVVEVTVAGVMSESVGIQTLERLRDVVKIAGFSCTDYTHIVEDIDSHLSTLMNSSASAQDPSHILTRHCDPDYSHMHPNPISDSYHAPQPGSATAAHLDLHYNTDIDYRNPDINSGHVPSADVPPGAGISPYDPLLSENTYTSRSSDFHTNFGLLFKS
ncbi:hypothetical protein D9758_016397 [Tetrapyrgos nigripes]|uniref:Zn(2)-C6 fungal-type domain-containing protein n=1 Tax=Tetrapyrgos nigripes TaxID=182062 RepID=A0A8H5C7V9_9AGAR|nr:hypothetical protein D9758_016397 [Tetrapyrgos nigripes]